MKKILIVEDQADIRRLLCTTLEDEGRELREAVDADAGWLAVLDWRPDLVLLDIMMPGSIDGLQLCERIKSDPATRATRVVLVSARGHRNDLGIGREAGADDYLSKPFSPQRLMEIAERLLQAPS
ncbi:MAG: response regulator [Burkholderiales bacterium]|nr:response regulator [Burkholderiales bacterium]MDE1927684.1 response regulator [Burkholderiales bacterium]MDE2158933.1 response regulator [Burkholderiales bacterium]MDE2505203.1 response regulator [Burkholderiales bacterium]